jgi:hypothetical protein
MYETREEAERCEMHHYVIQDVEFTFTQWSQFPDKVILTVLDPETGAKYKVPAFLAVDEEGENWELLEL